MTAERAVRRLGGAVRNAAVWGVAWLTLSFVVMIALRAISVVVPARVTVLDASGDG